MRICFLTLDYFPNKGGVQVATRELASELSKRNFHIDIITTGYSNKYLNRYDCNNIHRINIPKIYNKSSNNKIFIILFNDFIKKLKFVFYSPILIKKIMPNLIHAQNFHSAFSAFICYKLYNIPYVLTIHGELYLKKGSGAALPLFLKKYWSKMPHIKSASSVISLTEAAAEAAIINLGIKSIIIPNGVSRSFLSATYPKTILAENKINIICVSRLEKSKGVQDLLEALQFLNNIDYELYVVGDGLFKNELINQARLLGNESRVKFIGDLDHQSIIEYLDRCHVFVSPSHSEGFNLSTLEAMSRGLPIVVTTVGFFSKMVSNEIIPGWSNGYCVSPGNPKELSDNIKKVILNNENYATFSNNSLTVAKKYSWNSVADRYIAEILILGNRTAL